MVLSTETARISMKVHAYFREKMLNGINKDSKYAKFIPNWAIKRGVTEEDLDLPNITIEDFGTELKRYFYFFFCPSLVYRDEYIRRKEIRWNVLFKNLATFWFVIFYVWCVFKGLCLPLFRNTNASTLNARHYF